MMINIIKYPLSNSLTGDVQICQSRSEIANSRAYMFLDVKYQERAIKPSYGNSLNLFHPTESTPELEAEYLQLQLNEQAISKDPLEEQYTFNVTANNLDFKDRLNINIAVI